VEGVTRPASWPAAAAWGGVALLAAALLAQLAPQAARAVLNTDECFHAHVAGWIAAHGRLPDRIPEFYAGLPYYYPPLLHIVGAAWVLGFGIASLPLLNVVLFAVLLVALALLPVPGLAGAPRRWASWLVISNVALAIYAVRFYVEMLNSALGLLVALLLLRVVATRRLRDGALLGLAGGFSLLAKHTALVIPGLFVVLVGLEAIARRRDGVRAALAALLITLALALPMFVRNQALFGSPIYPALARDLDPWLYQLNLEKFSGSLRFYLVGVWETVGPWVLTLAGVALVVAIARRRRDVYAAMVVVSIAGIALAPLFPLHDARHTMPLIAVLALSGSVILHDALRSHARLGVALECGLAALALFSVLTLGDRRTPLDVDPALMEAYAEVDQIVPAGESVLSLWTYDTAYHSHRPATWPIPWGQGARSPAALFREQDPTRFLAEMDRLEIRWVLMVRARGATRFNGANYPRSFVDCVVALANRGAVRGVWASGRYLLVERVR
jgi:hypothetical protein